MSARISALPALLVALLVAGCADRPVNPSFPISNDQAREALHEMAAAPKRLDRPLVIVGGYQDPGLGGLLMQWQLEPLIRDRRIVTVCLLTAATFDDCRGQIIESVDKAFPTADGERTAEVDVIGLSMGGLAARYAALPKPGQRALRVARMFAISSPLRGAKLATLPTWDRKQIQMRRGSRLYQELAAEDERSTARAYKLVPYVRLNDRIVGASNAAPPGRTAWWVPVGLLDLSHIGAGNDPRIIADIARRLRDEQPFTTEPAAPLPALPAS